METKANNFLARKVNMIVLVITAGGSRLITRFSFFKVKMNCNDSIQPLYISIGQPCLRVNSRYPSERRRYGTERECDVTSELPEGDWEQGFTLGKIFFASSLFELARVV